MNGAAVTESAMAPDPIAEHDLSEAEYRRAREILGRDPNLTELGIFAAMWSEHCSYKSSKKWLKRAADGGALGDPGAPARTPASSTSATDRSRSSR